MVYIDDILIMKETFELYLELVGKMLKMWVEYGIKIIVEKCEFFKNIIQFLSLSSEEITAKELKQFLVLINFQRKFIPRYSKLQNVYTNFRAAPKEQKQNGFGREKSSFSEIKRSK